MDDLTAPRQRWTLIRKLLPRRLQPLARGIRKRQQRLFKKLDEPFYSVFPFTQASVSRQQNLINLAKRIDAEGIPGAIVECGVLDGGTAALMGWTSMKRQIHLFDAWKGLPATTAEDGAESSVWTGHVVGSPRRVLAVMRRLGIDVGRIHIHRGWFDDTFPNADVSPVSLVHVDCDFYEPTKLCLEKWYPVLSSRGFMQFDDYSEFIGCKRAVDEFLVSRPELELQSFGNAGTAYFIQKP